MTGVQVVEDEPVVEKMVTDGIREIPASELHGRDVSDPSSATPEIYEQLLIRGTAPAMNAVFCALTVHLAAAVRSEFMPFLSMEIKSAYEAGLADGYVQGVQAEADRSTLAASNEAQA